MLEPLEATITGEFILAITGQSVGELERKLFSLLVCLGGPGLASPLEVAGFEFNVSESVTFALSTQIIQQRNNFDPTVFADQRQAKIDVVALRRQRQASLVSQIAPLLPPNLQRILTLSSEKGAEFF